MAEVGRIEWILINALGCRRCLPWAKEQSLYSNCVAYAASETHRWWWPTAGYYWPDDVPRAKTLQSFIQAFATLGYTPCENGTLEVGFEKVAIFAADDETPTHMAQQLPSGDWMSKCGRDIVIQHELDHALEGELYGTVVQFLKRPRNNQSN